MKIIFIVIGVLFTLYVNGQIKLNLYNTLLDTHSKIMITECRFEWKNKQDTRFIVEVFGQQSNSSFQLKRNYNDNRGYTHYVYQQYHLGLEVVGATIGLHEKGNIVHQINANYATIKAATLTPLLNEKIITQKLHNLLTTQDAKQNLYGIIRFSKVSGSSLCYTQNKEKDFVLSYKVAVLNEEDIYYCYMDANTGEYLFTQFPYCGQNAPGTGATTYSGTQGFIGDEVGGQYRLRQIRSGVQINTLNNNNSDDETGVAGTDIWDNDNNWTAAEHTTNKAGLDIHWGTEKVFDYWKLVHNRNSINNAGMTINSYFHWKTNANNAVWHPTYQHMLYGDGDGVNYSHFGTLDVCAHELGHGINQFTSNLFYGNVESGALNEGFSDIWGACVENYAAPTKPIWLNGSEYTLTAPYYTRSFSNPNSGKWPQPDTYFGTHWGSLGGSPHINSGVLNHWFYLLSVGGTGTNDLGNFFNVTGIGINKAEKIAYATELFLLTNDGYAQARAQSILQTRNIYGICSLEEIAVTNAWHAVGVGNPYEFAYNLTVYNGYHPIHTNGKIRFYANWNTSTQNVYTVNWYNAANNQLIGTTTGYSSSVFDYTPNCPTVNSYECLAFYATIESCTAGSVITSNISGGSFQCKPKVWTGTTPCYGPFRVSQNSSQLLASPNPTKNKTSIILPTGQDWNGSYELLSANNTIVQRGRITAIKNNFEIDLSGLSNGIYTLILRTRKEIKQIKIIKE